MDLVPAEPGPMSSTSMLPLVLTGREQASPRPPTLSPRTLLLSATASTTSAPPLSPALKTLGPARPTRPTPPRTPVLARLAPLTTMPQLANRTWAPSQSLFLLSLPAPTAVTALLQLVLASVLSSLPLLLWLLLCKSSYDD